MRYSPWITAKRDEVKGLLFETLFGERRLGKIRTLCPEKADYGGANPVGASAYCENRGQI